MSHHTILDENKAYWTGRAPSYSEVNQGELSDDHREKWRSVLTGQISSRFPAKSPAEISILEVGTGPGFFAIILAEAGYPVTAIDLTPGMLAEARKNAGSLPITFLEMDAEALRFPDSSFDVIVTRNLTWNLPHPEQGYSEWCRVLKPGGLLLNFDANWYNYLFDEKARADYEQDRSTTAELGLEDQNVGENFDVMENIARRLTLSALRRPEWDSAVLTELGMQAEPDEAIWQQVWSESEKASFASTPMFMIRAWKPTTQI